MTWFGRRVTCAVFSASSTRCVASVAAIDQPTLRRLNAPDAFILALVQVEGGFAQAPVYLQRFFQREFGFAETAVVFSLADLLSLTQPMV